jgi:predicted GNAT family acetyltransferase
MGYYSVNSDQAKISHVSTPVESRGKGYAANLVYEMTKKILDLGLVPLLYTDYKYAASNKAYINAGYEPQGILINFSCSKSKL